MFRLIWRLWILTLPASLAVLAFATMAAPYIAASEQVVFIARASGKLQLMIADLSRGKRATLIPAGVDVFQPSVSPHSREVVYASRAGAMPSCMSCGLAMRSRANLLTMLMTTPTRNGLPMANLSCFRRTRRVSFSFS